MKNLDYNTLHVKNNDYMKNFDCNQIKIFINLEIIGEDKDKDNKIYIYFFLKKNLKKFLQFSEDTWRNHGFSAQLLLYSI